MNFSEEVKESDENKIELITCSLQLIKTKHITQPQLVHDLCVRESLTNRELLYIPEKYN